MDSMEHGYWLGSDRSRRDLKALGSALSQGTAVIVYMPNELEMTASLRFDANEDVWWADTVADTIKYLDGGA